jgi:hypothetical protein
MGRITEADVQAVDRLREQVDLLPVPPDAVERSLRLDGLPADVLKAALDALGSPVSVGRLPLEADRDAGDG